MRRFINIILYIFKDNSIFNLLSEKIHPISYIIIYIFSIYAFGSIYEHFPSAFYAPYVNREPSTRNDARDLIRNIMRHANFKIIDEGPDKIPFDDDIGYGDSYIEISPNTLKFSILFGEDISKPFVLLYIKCHSCYLDGSNKTIRKFDQYVIEFQINLHSRSQHLPAGPIYQYEFDDYANVLLGGDDLFFQVIYRKPRNPDFRSELAEKILDKITIKIGEDRYLQLDQSYSRKASGFLRGINGDPSGLSDNHWRMLYFSAIVITTVGLGDIIPITSKARLLVASEAVVGLALFGLFLNAVAHRASKKRRSNSDGEPP